ncbi:NAD(P)-binding domain-containing protein [Nocardia puris]|uniref:flavin-containing monooxygenase n=1 Tax=Nocardia puris TaxID=208602 RepID=UPI0018941601|nr:NAD(P)-binding domain-containing protein [Nocardia puris]MBF6214730.1 NAD(P)-binding domain-containing protein [Nocardia puris]MBF6368796.1 NAD(P)-binding domain-containing protein [Nocardia puris]MBF6462376.1 NAD(P)-binding domain-containing protein [Nocardia puris]
MTETIIQREQAVAVVGAGPAGLSAARMLRLHGIDYDHFERHTDVGGLWDIDNPGTPMYESAHFISSRDVSGFYDFPMPGHFGDYPSRRQILEYTRNFADTFGLRHGIEFGTAVDSVVADGDGWLVTPAGGAPRRYRGVICASGTNWHPRIPHHPGEFDGEIRHAVTHRSAREFAGKRVLVVGLGNSGADIACDAAQSADAAFISVRRGYHIVPKHIFGVPADQLDESGASLPRWIERPVLAGLLRLLVGDVTRWGLPKPDHKLFESHPLLNSQLLHHLQHADITAKPDIARFDGPDVVFADGSRERVDVVLYATGYEMRIPYADPDLFSWNGDRPAQYLTAFNRRHRNLFTLGFLEVNSSAYTLFDNISHVLAQYLRDQTDRPAAAARFDHLIATHHPDLSGGLRMVSSARHAGYVDAKTYKKVLADVRTRMQWPDLEPGFADHLRRTEVGVSR